MKRLGLIVIALAVGITLIAPIKSFCYTTNFHYDPTTGYLMNATTIDPYNANRKIDEVIYKKNGQRDYSLSYTEGALSDKTTFSYDGNGKLLSSNKISEKDLDGDGKKDFNLTTFYDGSGQSVLTVDNNLPAQTYGIFMGDGNDDPANLDDAASRIQGAGGAAVVDILRRLQTTGVRINGVAGFDTSSGFNFTSLTGKVIVSASVDTNGDGVTDTTYGFQNDQGQPAWTEDDHVGHGIADNKGALYATSRTVTDASGKQIGKDGSTFLTDPSRLNPKTNGHWDPAITLAGALGRDNSGFYVIDGSGVRHNLVIASGNDNIVAELAQNLGRQISVTGDYADDDPGATNISLQQFEFVG